MGKDEVIMVELKPTSHTGVLLSSSSAKGDYIVLEMINGSVSIACELRTHFPIHNPFCQEKVKTYFTRFNKS